MFKKKLINQNKILIVDGIIGGGKSLLSPLLSSLPKVDPWQMNYWFDQTASLFNLNLINLKTAEHLIKTNHNVIFYDNSILRNMNFRKSDNSSIFKHPRIKNIKKRMNENDHIVFKKNEKKIINHYCTHMISNYSEPFLKAFKDKLVFVKLYRSPCNLEMFMHIAKWATAWENIQSRDGWIKIYDKIHKKNYPHFMKYCKNIYLKSNKYEKAILILEYIFYNDNLENLINKKNYKTHLIKITFENLVKNPIKYLNKISKKLDTKVDKISLRTLKKLNLPRSIDLDKDYSHCIFFLKNKISDNFMKKLIKLYIFYKKNVFLKY